MALKNVIRQKEDFWRRLGVAVLTAFIFGFVLSTVLAVGASLNIGALRTVERLGIDLGGRLHTVVRSSLETSAIEGAPSIVLLDIDEEGCAAFADPNACRFDYIGREQILERAVIAARQGGARAIVLDFVLPDAKEAAEMGFDLQSAAGETPLLVPLPLRSSSDGAVISWQRTVCGAPKCGSIEYLPSDAIIVDGKSRYFDQETTFTWTTGGPDATTGNATLPALAWRAAQLMDSDLAPPPVSQVPIRYTFPSFSSGDAQSLGETNEQVTYLSLSQFDPGENGLDLPPQTRDALVIIGSSAPGANDLHETPLGTMAGMEVMANSVLTFTQAEKAPAGDSGLLKVWWTKIEAFLFGLLIVAVVEGAMLKVADMRSAATRNGLHTVESGAFWDRFSWLFLITMIGLMAFELVVAAASIGAQFDDDSYATYEIDVIWPIIGVMLSALIGFANKFVAKVEWIAERLPGLRETA